MQRQSVPTAGAGGGHAPPIVGEVLRTGGHPLDGETRDSFAESFRFDFSGVRVHTDSQAAESARAVNALAYTVGPHLVFDQGRYAPHNADGRRLLAHELAHVVQQSGTAPARGEPEVASADEPQEREADAAAETALSAGRGTAPLIPARSSGPFRLARQEAPRGTGGGGVDLVEISTASSQIRFHTRQGIFRYQLDHRGLTAGEYTAAVTTRGRSEVHFTLEGMVGGDFEFSWRIEPGQPNPATFFAAPRQTSVRFRISDEAFPPVTPQQEPSTPTDPNAVVLTPEEAQRRCEANDLRVMTFPFRGTRFGAAPVMAQREGDFIVVKQPVYVLANDDFRAQTRTLPTVAFTSGVRLRPNEIVRVHLYEPHWYQLNITGSATGDAQREFCVTGEQMLQIAEASTNATLLNIGLTAVDAATLFIPVGRIASVVGRPLAGGARTLTAATMIGMAEAAPTALAGAASRATTTIVEEQVVTRVAGQAIVQSVSQTAVRASEQAAAGALPSVAGRTAAAATLPRLAQPIVSEAAGRGGVTVGAELTAGAVRPRLSPPGELTPTPPTPPGGGGPGGGGPGPSVPVPGGGPTGGVRIVLATNDTLIVDTQTARALEQGARGAIPPDQAALTRAHAETLRLIEAQPPTARGVTVAPETLTELGRQGPVAGVTNVLQPVTASAAEQQAVLTRLADLGVGGAGGVGDRQIVMQALLAPRAAGSVPTLVTADRQLINGLARSLGVDPARLGRYATVAEYFQYTQGSSIFTVTIENHTLRVYPVQVIRAGLR